MPYPTEQRFKLLQQQYADAEEIHAPAPSTKPQAVPCLIIDFITRSDTGDCLKVIPLSPKNITTTGELTFLDGSNPVPSNAGQMYYIRVYPVDCQPGDVRGSYQIGEPLMAYPYAMPGPNKGLITWVCVAAAALPSGEIQFQTLQMGSNNQIVWDFQRAHTMVT